MTDAAPAETVMTDAFTSDAAPAEAVMTVAVTSDAGPAGAVAGVADITGAAARSSGSGSGTGSGTGPAVGRPAPPGTDSAAHHGAASALAKTPVTIITGFLGAGKTTLIRHLMANPQGRRLAVLVNEFGSLGVDGDILKSCADANCPVENIVELANGCICCTVADDFIPTIEALMALPHRPDHILIETSGLALPKPLLKAFDWPAIRSRITVDGVIAVADAEAVAAGRFAPDEAAIAAQRAADPNVDHDTPLAEVFEDQIACADIILLSKADLAGDAGLAAARAVIDTESPRRLPVLAMTDGMIDPRVILGLHAAAEDDIAARPSHHDGNDDHEHDDFNSVVIDLPEITDTDALTAAIIRLAHDRRILRVKGHVAVAGRPLRLLVQAVGARVRQQYDRPWGPAERASRLVVIAETADIDEAAIRAVLLGDAKAVATLSGTVSSTPAPSTSAMSTSAPSTPAPSAPAPSTSAPSTSVPSAPAPSAPAPSTSAASTSAPSAPAPSTSAPAA